MSTMDRGEVQSHAPDSHTAFVDGFHTAERRSDALEAEAEWPPLKIRCECGWVGDTSSAWIMEDEHGDPYYCPGCSSTRGLRFYAPDAAACTQGGHTDVNKAVHIPGEAAERETINHIIQGTATNKAVQMTHVVDGSCCPEGHRQADDTKVAEEDFKKYGLS